jgi:hypothetical protein
LRRYPKVGRDTRQILELESRHERKNESDPVALNNFEPSKIERREEEMAAYLWFRIEFILALVGGK